MTIRQLFTNVHSSQSLTIFYYIYACSMAFYYSSNICSVIIYYLYRCTYFNQPTRFSNSMQHIIFITLYDIHCGGGSRKTTLEWWGKGKRHNRVLLRDFHRQNLSPDALWVNGKNSILLHYISFNGVFLLLFFL